MSPSQAPWAEDPPSGTCFPGNVPPVENQQGQPRLLNTTPATTPNLPPLVIFRYRFFCPKRSKTGVMSHLVTRTETSFLVLRKKGSLGGSGLRPLQEFPPSFRGTGLQLTKCANPEGLPKDSLLNYRKN